MSRAAARRSTGTDRLVGVVLIATSSTAFGIMPVLTKVAYEDGADPVGVLSVRFALAGGVLLGLAAARRQALPRGRRLGLLVALGAVGYVAQSLAYFSALTRVSAGLAALLLYLYPALVAVIGVVFLRHRPRPAAVVCLLGALAGTALTIGPVPSGQGLGVLLGLGSAVAYAVYVVVSGGAVRGVGPFAAAGVVMSSAAVVYAGVAAVTRPALPGSGRGWLAVLLVAGVCTVVATSTFFAGLDRLGAPDASVVSTLEPVVSVVLAALVLDERLGPLQLAGGVLVLAAVTVLARLGARDEDAVPPRLDAP